MGRLLWLPAIVVLLHQRASDVVEVHRIPSIVPNRRLTMAPVHIRGGILSTASMQLYTTSRGKSHVSETIFPAIFIVHHPAFQRHCFAVIVGEADIFLILILVVIARGIELRVLRVHFDIARVTNIT